MTQAVFDNIVQVGVVVDNVDAAIKKYRQLLDLYNWHINYVDTQKGKGANYRSGEKPIESKSKIAWIKMGNVELEIIEPQDEDSEYKRFLQEKGPGIHHIMFATPDYSGCVERMAANGIPVLRYGEFKGTRFHLFDTLSELGLVCEIAEGEPLEPDEPM